MTEILRYQSGCFYACAVSTGGIGGRGGAISSDALPSTAGGIGGNGGGAVTGDATGGTGDATGGTGGTAPT